MERFFRSLKNEWVPVTGYVNFSDAAHAITDYEDKRLKSLEEVNARLKKLLAVVLMCDAIGLTQHRAYGLTGLSLSTCRYEAQRPAADAHLSGRINELSWPLNAGVLVIGASGLRRKGFHVNHKRVYCFYHL